MSDDPSEAGPTFVIPVTTDAAEWLSFSPGPMGWAIFRSDQYDHSERMVFVRFAADRPLPWETREDGSVHLDDDHPDVQAAFAVIREVHLAFDEGIGPRVMRDVPLARIEAAVNQPAHRADVLVRCPPPFVVQSNVPSKGPADWLLAPAPTGRRRPSLKLRIPQGRGRPDSFYEQVAQRFAYLTTVSRRPAKDLADANGVPETTVHGWVKEARRRGLLSAGERGKGGQQ